ncbi:hypothetical protein HZ326_16930 [Fusarium oxysporum f. sp. albedinis]|nr:hypothetical protein HZ326_16930 [Fusarium oxysporum f. sp. albedinis]
MTVVSNAESCHALQFDATYTSLRLLHHDSFSYHQQQTHPETPFARLDCSRLQSVLNCLHNMHCVSNTRHF